MKTASKTGMCRVSGQICQVFLVVALVALGAGEVGASKVRTGANIPVAHSKDVSTYRNRPVPIEISATTSSLTRLEFMIREEPKFGKLSVITPVVGDNRKAQLVYTPDPGATAALDSFKYTAQVPGQGPSGAAIINIRILNPMPRLEVAAPVQFRKVKVGEVGRASFMVRNVGQARFRGRIELLSPWVLDRDVLEVEPGATERVTVEFRPLVPGKVGTRLQLQADQKASVVGIYAEAIAPFSVRPGKAELVASGGDGKRRVTLVLKNTTDQPMVISLHAPIDPEHPLFRLKFPEKLEISAGGESRAELSLPADDLGAFDEVLTLSSKMYSVEVHVVAEALPAQLVLKDAIPGAGWDFGVVLVGKSAEAKTFVLENLGGESLVATVNVNPPFAINGVGQSIEVKGGEKIPITVLPETKNSGEFRSELVLDWADGEMVIPLSIKIELPEMESKPGTGIAGENRPPVAPPPAVDPGGGVSGGSTGSSVTASDPRTLFSPTQQDTSDALFDAYAAHYGLSLNESPYYAKLERVDEIKLVRGDHRAVDLSWKKAGPGVDNYIIEMARMYRDVNNGGKLVKRWVPWDGETERLPNVGTSMVVRLQPVASGTEYHFRVVARDAEGRQALPSEPIVLITGVPESFWKTVFRVFIILLGLVALFVVYRIIQWMRDGSEKGKVYAGVDHRGGVRGVLDGLRGAIFR